MGRSKAFSNEADTVRSLARAFGAAHAAFAAWTFDTEGPDATKSYTRPGKFVTETDSRLIDLCLQLHGGLGYLSYYSIETIIHDLQVPQILDGTNEIMCLIVARQMRAKPRQSSTMALACTKGRSGIAGVLGQIKRGRRG